jgi:hypothetical protein
MREELVGIRITSISQGALLTIIIIIIIINVNRRKGLGKNKQSEK